MKKKHAYRLSRHFGAWDAAELAIQKTLIAAGMKCEFPCGRCGHGDASHECTRI